MWDFSRKNRAKQESEDEPIEEVEVEEQGKGDVVMGGLEVMSPFPGYPNGGGSSSSATPGFPPQRNSMQTSSFGSPPNQQQGGLLVYNSDSSPERQAHSPLKAAPPGGFQSHEEYVKSIPRGRVVKNNAGVLIVKSPEEPGNPSNQHLAALSEDELEKLKRSGQFTATSLSSLPSAAPVPPTPTNRGNAKGKGKKGSMHDYFAGFTPEQMLTRTDLLPREPGPALERLLKKELNESLPSGLFGE